jgi:dihydroorotase
MNGGMKDLLNVAGKLMAAGETLEQVVAQMTSRPALEIHQQQLGNLSPGAPADVAVLSLESGNFGFTDMYNTRLNANRKLVCQLTLRDGKVVYDLNGISADAWDAKEHSADVRQKDRWTTFNERPISKNAFPVSVPVGQLATPK